MKKAVPMWKAIIAVIFGCSYTAIGMYKLGEVLLMSQAQTYEFKIQELKARLHEDED